ncbi:hypothetical protein [Mycobacterium sp. AT1]|uniref:hypothetical protein n=1 Tax=Mycobacterium sp. AT1 TaxID=1961706 RepID=UPI0009ABCC5A|nr:hypothetical protein [Mycobacterium sp. AT1]OPX08351.1 hypothetical protein B1790_19860 [Mycobacterium sp. AT1]
MTVVQDELFTPQTGTTIPAHVLSYGLGADSTAILIRWLLDASSRDFDLDDLVVVTAHTGDEFASTVRDVEEVVLPLLARHNVRFVQAGRTQLHTTAGGDGIDVFSDTTQPTTLHASDGYALSDELLAAATVPQLGSRRCSLRAKGAVLDPIIARLTAGQSFRHYLGFETGELRRAERDAAYNTDRRLGVYPLLKWGWSRTDALDYLREVTGRSWQKSACSYCPFQFSSKVGRSAAIDRYRREPDAAMRALYLEHVAACFNPRQSLLAQGRLADAVGDAGLDDVLRHLAEHVGAQVHGLYEVRRVATPRRGSTPAFARSVRRLDSGPAADMDTALAQLPGEPGADPDGITRVWRRHRADAAPWVEHFYVVAPTDKVHDKQRPGFEALFATATDATPTLV